MFLCLSLSQIEEEFWRITLKPLQSTILGKLDQHMLKLLSLCRRKGGAIRKKLDETLDMLNEAHTYKNVAVLCSSISVSILNIISFYIFVG